MFNSRGFTTSFGGFGNAVHDLLEANLSLGNPNTNSSDAYAAQIAAANAVL